MADPQHVDTAFVEQTSEEPRMPGHESALDRKPQWQPRYPGSGRLAGKVAIVTGGDSGIGRATAVLFAREGAKVAIAYLEEHDDARITRDACEAEGAEILLSAGDLGDPDHCRGLVDAVIEKWGRLDVLVNNAGEQHPDENVTEITAEQLQRQGRADPARLQRYQGGDHRLYPLVVGKSRGRRHPGQRGRTGSHLDAPQSLRGAAAREHGRFRRGYAHGPSGRTQRGRPRFPLPRLRRQFLHVGTGAASQWRDRGQRLT